MDNGPEQTAQPAARVGDQSSVDRWFVTAPSITLPKGGGAIRGIGEKFAANPVTGTGSMSVPIATSPGRSGFGPQLSLSYDSGAGNGPFGFGWSLSLPSITRKTDKGLPRYLDSADSDVFLLSGAEDLVPALVRGSNGKWAEPSLPPRTVGGKTYRIRRYRPRIEGLFARIERWTNVAAAEDVHWRAISRDNVLTVYGLDAESRIADPLDPTRIFSWLICETRDDKGNAVLYGYKAEDGTGIDLVKAHERNRGTGTDVGRAANRYLKRIRYGNRTSALDDNTGQRPPVLDKARVAAQIANATWMFEVVFDYGDHDLDTPRPNDDKAKDAPGSLKYPWKTRPDPFSVYRSGFEVRTYRLCQRVLMFHHFPGQADVGRDCLVRSTDFTYSDEVDPTDVRNPVYTFLQAVAQTSYVRNNGSYDRRSTPPVELEYTRPTVQEAVEEIDAHSLENLPVGVDDSAYRWTDLHGEGIPGILTEQAGAWFYKRNFSPVPDKLSDGREIVKAKFSALEIVAEKPNVAFAGGAELMDLAGDGQPDVVVMEGPTSGLYEHDDAESWQPFRPFTARLNRGLRDPNVKLIDLDGDGHADVLISEDDAFVWHASLAEEGFGPARRVAQALDEEKGPRIVFADGTQSVYLADLSGDGLTDIVRIRNGEVCYWPNLGHGRFGAKVTMDNAPWFDEPDQFDQRRVRIADIDGSGTTDILYLHRDGVRLYFNQSGNSWSQPHTLKVFPRIDELASIVPTDLLGNGTACLVWSSPLVGDASRRMRYVNLMGAHKPHLLVKLKNNLGATTDVHYAPSTKFYLQDKRAGKAWITRLPFPVHVVERVSVTDKWRGTTFSTTYSYHHGYFDGVEREFRGFGRVEQIDTEDYGKFSAGNVDSPYVTKDHKLYQAPVKTVTWFHTGVFVDQGRVLSLYSNEYFPSWLEALRPGTTDVLGGFKENELAGPDFADLDLTADEWREALRACKGVPLRQEIYELDVDALRDGTHRPVKLFSTAYHNCHIDRLQPRGAHRHSVFLATESEAITYHYELDLRAMEVKPDPRVSHTLNLRIDEFGRVLQSVEVGYPRFQSFEDPDGTLTPQIVSLARKVQGELHIAYAETRYTERDIDEPDTYRLRLPCEIQTYELTGIGTKDASDSATTEMRDDRYFSIDELRAYRMSEHYQTSGKAVGLLQYHEQPDRTSLPPPAEKRLVEHVRTLYFDDGGAATPTEPLAFGRHGPRGLKYEDYKLALTEDLLAAIFGAKLAESIAGSTAKQKLASAATSGYLSGSDLADRFDPLDTTGQYWIRSGIAGFAPDAARHFFLPERYEDPFGNVTEIAFDTRDFYIESTKDARGNEMRIVDFDFRVLAPRALRDANGNVARAAFDVLAMPVAVAFESGGDTAAGLSRSELDLSSAEITEFMEREPYRESDPRRWLGKATARFVYHFGEVVDANGNVIAWEGRPAAACEIQRETHVAQLGGRETKIQVSIEYSDGGGNVLVKKAQAEPDPDSTRPNPPMRWIASGKTILNNKGKPVKQYEPYFSDTEHRFDGAEAEREAGITPVMYYDASSRLIRTELPDGTLTRVEFSPWRASTFDANDTIKASRWYRERLTALERGAVPALADNTEETKANAASPDEKRAARLAALHFDTPAETLLDSLGREVVSIAHNREPSQAAAQANVLLEDRPWLDRRHITFTKLDAEGKPLWVRDARAILVMQYLIPQKPYNDPSDDMPYRIDAATGKRIYSAPCYDIAGNLLFQHSTDAGDRWMVMDAAGKPMLAWDLNDKGPGTVVQKRIFHTEYDKLHRPTKQWLKIDSAAAALVEAFDYCDTDQPAGAASLTDAKQRNLIGQPVRHWDPSGLLTVERIDLGGAPAVVTRTLIKPDADGGTGVLSWNIPNRSNLLEGETFSKLTEYDALKRVTRLYNWHRDITFGANGAQQSTPGATNRVAVYEPEYNERGELVAEWLHVRATKTTNQHGQASFGKDAQRSRQVIKRITYDAKGQKQSLELRNGTTTHYTYDPDTFRLVHLFTRRSGTVSVGDCTSNTADMPRPQRPCGMQNLHYTYDAVGNITHIQDDAQHSRYFANDLVEPSSDYAYDAFYRLIEATGRENAAAVAPPRNREDPWASSAFPSADALRSYTQRYRYDAVGNFVEITHLRSAGGGWARRYAAKADSNRLDRGWYGNNTTRAITYRHDAHGNILNLNRVETPPPLDAQEQWGLDVRWDWRDMILGFDLGGGGLARYQYGVDKQRTRKRITRNTSAGGTITEDRIYLGGYELYRRYLANGSTPVEEIESQHLFEDQQRVLLVDDVVRAGGSANPRPDGLSVKAQTLFRYQYGNHLESAVLELDGEAKVISYEEYHPYGTTAYRLMSSAAEAPAKRYRFTGMERDEESGLYCCGARFHSPSLGRWTAPDPAPQSRAQNLYVYCENSPLCFTDKTGRTSIKTGVSEATFLYSLDHLLAQNSDAAKANPSLLVSAKNLMLLPLSDNSAKQDLGDVTLPSKPGISLAEARKQGPQAFFRAAQQMMQGSLGDTEELNAIWQRASKNEKNTYDTSRTNFFARLRTETSPEADLVREAFAQANIGFDDETGLPKMDKLKSLGVSPSTLKTMEGQRRNPSKTMLRTYVAKGLESAKQKAVAAKNTAVGATKQIAKSLIPGSEFYDEAKLVGGGSAYTGASVMLQAAKEVVRQGVQVVHRYGRQLLTAGAGVAFSAKVAIGAAGTALTTSATAAFSATTLGGIGAAGAGAVGVAATAVVAAGAVGYGIGTIINKTVVEPLLDKLAPGSGALGDWYYRTFLK